MRPFTHRASRLSHRLALWESGGLLGFNKFCLREGIRLSQKDVSFLYIVGKVALFGALLSSSP